MPFYDKTDNYKEIFAEYKKKKLPDLVMPKGERSTEGKFLDWVNSDNRGRDEDRDRKLLDLWRKIREKVISYNEENGVDKPLDECITWEEPFSTGGSHDGEDMLKYLAIHINGLVVLEPIDEYKNATYIFEEDNYIDWKLGHTREDIVKMRLGYKIAHIENDMYSDYNYDAANILRILDAVAKDKSRFLSDITPEPGREYCNAKRVFRKRDIRKLVEDYEISYEELADIINRYSKETELTVAEDEIINSVNKIIPDAERVDLHKKIKNYIPRKKGSDSVDSGGRE